MPLTDKDANTASSSATRKRPLDDFLQPVTAGQLAGSPKSSPSADKTRSAGSDKENAPFKKSAITSSPPAKSPGLTASGSSPFDRESPSPNTPSKVSSSNSPLPTVSDNVASTTDTTATSEPAKKKRATAAEVKQRREEAEKAKAAKAEELERKKREKEEAEKAKAEEAEKKKREKEEADKLKAEEREKKRLEKEEADKLKAAKKEEREKKKREKEEEAAKKQRSQLTLTKMFGKPVSTSNKSDLEAKSNTTQSEASDKKTSSKDKDAPKSFYDQMFKPFFVKDHVKLARNPCEMDDESREIKTRALEEFIEGKRTLETDRFDPLEALQIPFKPKRGCVYPSVKKIMDEFTGESQTSQAHHVRELLKSVPIKSLKFYQDVRPPYIGTISGLPPGVKSLKKVSRNPFSRDILPLAYDYDSEAEWQDEEGEDVDDLDDEEEELDGDEDMDDFLDDADDTAPSRMVFSGGGMEPESTGLCWENRKRLPSELKMCKYRMEFIHDKLEHRHSIDPFSTAYWECPKIKSEPVAASSTTLVPISDKQTTGVKGGSVRSISNPMAPPSGPSDAFSAITGRPKKSQTLLPVEYQEKLKDLVRSKPTLSKVGVIELFAAEHPSLVKAQVKNSFDALIVKNGKENKVKGE
ncbi:chromatin assembly factor 1 subunit rlf2 [Podospora fimiseda]|uniref:Chromatin assembly factor 1 subunit rlf2 n=1 Tax=Podospora fimiseda TaxID=252190 RepID=A0AAN7BKB1_9PEZI|nr:chromatin assembly factor 1 subunit rlf2 [Podospora fimiseda]